MFALTQLPEWRALHEHWQKISSVHMRSLFEENPYRFTDFSLQFDGILLDFSKNRIVEETLSLLIILAERIGLPQKITDLFSGKHVNFTQQRPALHMDLRVPQPSREIQQTFDRMEYWVNKINRGECRGFSGEAITDVINVGIGGSHIGPLMVSQALKPFAASPITLHFLSTAHSGNFKEILNQIDPARTLIIIASKSFTTTETLLHMKYLQEWFAQHSGSVEDFFNQVLAITANKNKALELGIKVDQVLEFWDWVGGRYSIWSAIGLPVALSLGMEHFKAFLAGAHSMDQHFQTAPLKINMPVILGLLGIWYRNFFNAASTAIIPYNYYLRCLPLYLQQLEMESNGKRTLADGSLLDIATAPVIWGEMGTDSQHAFHQFFHQSGQLVPIDFILDAAIEEDCPEHHRLLLASCLAQSATLMAGKSREEIFVDLVSQGCSVEQAEQLAPHKICQGNCPSNTFLLEGLTPYNLGALLALYEHKVFVQAMIWGINPFDQWGVELGKQMANQLLHYFDGRGNYDSSTMGLIKACHLHPINLEMLDL